MNAYIEEIERALSKYPMRTSSQVPESYIGGGQSSLRYLGLKVPHLRQAAKEGFSFSHLDRSQQLRIWDSVWKNSDCFEVMALSLSWAYDSNKNHDLTEIWPTLQKWSARIDNWAHSDTLSGIYARLLEQNPKLILPTLQKWSRSKNPWLRRQSIVSLMYYSSHRKRVPPLRTLLKLIEAQLEFDHYYVQKGVGWSLRETFNVYPKEAYAFIEKNVLRISAHAFSAATEKMSRPQKDRLKALRKTRKGQCSTHKPQKRGKRVNAMIMAIGMLTAVSRAIALPQTPVPLISQTGPSSSCRQVFLNPANVQYRSAVAHNPESEYAETFANLVLSLEAKPNQLRELAEHIFLVRLDWSKEHDKDFYQSIHTFWQNRYLGRERTLTMYTTPQDPHMLNPKRYFLEAQPLGKLFGFESWEPMQLKHFPSPIDDLLGQKYFFLAYRQQAPARLSLYDKYIYSHARSEDIPQIMGYLENLWNEISAAGSHVSLKHRLQRLAEFEWIFFRTNPFGRGAATTGRVLSLLLQKHLSQVHSDFRIETEFDRYDQLALDLEFTEYTALRVSGLIRRPH